MLPQIIKELQRLTCHKDVHVTSSGNKAIFTALAVAKASGKKTVLIPSEGGWLSYKTYPEMLGLRIVEVKTELGVIDLNDLAEKAKNDCCFLYNSLAGYVVEHDVESINKICRAKGCLTINDCTGLLGTDICQGDILVASFGKGKVINAGYGGVISFSSSALSELAHIPLYSDAIHDSAYADILHSIKNLDKRQGFLFNLRDNIRADLKDFDVLHKDSYWAINVFVRCKDDSEISKVVEYCKQHKYPYVICPKYIKLNVTGVSIEVKKVV